VIEPIVIYLEHMSKETLDVAKSHTSWMNFKDNSQFQDIEQNPCNFSYVKTITKLEEYKERAFNPDGTAKPLIILTSVSSMNQGYARALLKDFAAEKKNEIVFVEIQNAQVPKESVAAKLLQKLIYFVIDNIKATSVVEKPVKAINDPRTRKTETTKRKTPIDELIETTAKLTDTESKQSKDTAASLTNGQHQNTIAED